MALTKLDSRDIAILKVLANEGRITKTELASRINLSPTPCWERLRRLEKAGIIEGYHAVISLKKIVPNITVFVTVELADHSAHSLRVFEEQAKRHDEIVACWSLGGGFDYLLQIIARDIDAYQELIDSLLEGGSRIARYYTYVVTKAVKQTFEPPFDDLVSNAPDETTS